MFRDCDERKMSKRGSYSVLLTDKIIRELFTLVSARYTLSCRLTNYAMRVIAFLSPQCFDKSTDLVGEVIVNVFICCRTNFSVRRPINQCIAVLSFVTILEYLDDHKEQQSYHYNICQMCKWISRIYITQPHTNNSFLLYSTDSVSISSEFMNLLAWVFFYGFQTIKKYPCTNMFQTIHSVDCLPFLISFIRRTHIPFQFLVLRQSAFATVLKIIACLFGLDLFKFRYFLTDSSYARSSLSMSALPSYFAPCWATMFKFC